MKQIRCSKCNKLLCCISDDLNGQIEIKCMRCKHTEQINK